MLAADNGSLNSLNSGCPATWPSSFFAAVGQATNAPIAIMTRAAPQKAIVFVFSFIKGFRLRGLGGGSEFFQKETFPFVLGYYFRRALVMFSRSRSRREANTITPMTSGGMQGRATAAALTWFWILVTF